MTARVFSLVRRAFSRQERARLGHIAKMRLRGVDLTGATIQELKLDPQRSNWHTSSGGPGLRRILDELDISAADRALDLGCGKGGAMLTLACYPFQSVDGVEISPQLCDIARTNVRRMRILNATIFCCDAAAFSQLDDYSFLYMFNPFPAAVMRSVLANLRASLARRPRPVRVLYRNPACGELLLGMGFRLVRCFDDAAFPLHLFVWS